MQPELLEERGESPRHAPLSGRPGKPLTPRKSTLAEGEGKTATLLQPPPSPVPRGLAPAGGGAAPSQLMLAAKGGFIRVPLKKMLIVTFLHD